MNSPPQNNVERIQMQNYRYGKIPFLTFSESRQVSEVRIIIWGGRMEEVIIREGHKGGFCGFLAYILTSKVIN